jgi:hypothetical protein
LLFVTRDFVFFFFSLPTAKSFILFAPAENDDIKKNQSFSPVSCQHRNGQKKTSIYYIPEAFSFSLFFFQQP